MADEPGDFEGIDINGPWGGVRIGAGGARMRRGGADWDEEDDELRRVRRRVRQKLDFYRHAALFAAIVGGLALIDWASGGGWWVQWLAIIWGAFLAIQFWTTFVSQRLWGRDIEERMVQRELERRRGRVDVTPPPRPPDAP